MTTTEALYQIYLQHRVISTDTRKIAQGGLFFALKGDKFDANTFAGQAIEAGAAYAIIDNPQYKVNYKCLLVDDVLTSLQDLARYHRKQLTIPVVGLTGTNGKTTTKELINAVLSQHFKTLATQGNLNNHIGVPLTVLSINSSHEIAVVEMGANHQKEIEMLCTISQPSHGLITNVGKAHLEGFGGPEGVKIAKGELYDYLAKNGIAFVNSDSEDLMTMQAMRTFVTPPIFYGNGNESRVSGEITENNPLLTLRWTDNSNAPSHTLKTNLTGAYNLDNILAAITIGLHFGLSADEINKGIESYAPSNNRSQVTVTPYNTLICDYYNANPSSMVVAIDNVGKLQANKKVLVLGDMFELGDDAPAEHAAIIQKAIGINADQAVFIGKEFSDAGTSNGFSLSDKTKFYMTVEDAIAGFKANPVKDATILIKGSRGMALERLLELF